MDSRMIRKPFLKSKTLKLLQNKQTKELLLRPVKPQVVEASRKKSKALLLLKRRQIASKRSTTLTNSISSMQSRRLASKVHLNSLLASRSKRSPSKVISSFIERVKASQNATKMLKAPAQLIIRSNETEIKAFTKTVAKIFIDGPSKNLTALGVSIAKMPLAKAQIASYCIKFPLEHQHIRTELMNLAWALRRQGAFESVAVSGLKAAFYTVGAKTALRAERSYSWHHDLIRITQAHGLAPENGGLSMGENIVIAHPDTGWAPHSQFNEDFIDKSNSHDTTIDSIGDEAALHSIKNRDANVSNISHGTGTGSLILGGRPDDGLQTLSTVEELALEYDHLPKSRIALYINSKNVTDKPGHLSGIAPRATLLPIKFINEQQAEDGFDGFGVFRFFDTDLVKAIRYAIDEQAHVISLSVGGLMHDDVRQILDEAILEHDMIVVAAAGQTFTLNGVRVASIVAERFGLLPDDSVVLPAAYTNVIAVAGCTPGGAPWLESHAGPNIDITAPADAIWIADYAPFDENLAGNVNRAEQLRCGSGTSFAASIMAGASALWLAHWGRQNLLNQYGPSNIPLSWVFRHQLQLTATAAHADDWDTEQFGPGVINVEALLRQPLPSPDDVEAPPDMVNGIVPFVSNELGELQDVYLEFVDWLEDRADAAERAVAAAIVVAERLAHEGVEELSEKWAQLDAAAQELAGDAQKAAIEIKDGIENAISDGIEALEEIAEEAAEAAEDVWDTVEEAAEEFHDNVGEAAEDFYDYITGWF